MLKNNPIALIIMDGWGLAAPGPGNAISLAATPNLDKLQKNFSYTVLGASGACVGLPQGQDGNSEAGHMNLGAGRVIAQDAVKINQAINNGTFETNAAFIEAIDHVKRNNSRLHIMGLLTDGMSAHAYPDHLYALLALTEKAKVKQIYLHLFTDGRDSSQHGATLFLRALEGTFKNGEKIATIMGRYYAMERNKRWAITEKAYALLTAGKGLKANSAEEALTSAYNRGETDEFIKPTLIRPEGLIQNNDAIIYYNLRSDRARQLTKAFVQPEFVAKNPRAFGRELLKNTRFVAMTDFGPDLDSILTAFPSARINQTLPIMLKNKRQLYLAESEKYAHVTYFFNGGFADPVNGEERMMVPSPDCASYDTRPEMSAKQLTDILLDNIQRAQYDFYCVNFANPDMVGHTGNLAAAVKACACVDTQVGRVVAALQKAGGVAVITADHGNAEEMINLKTGEVDTKHSINPVPLIITQKGIKFKSGAQPCLGTVAPTLLKLFNQPAAQDMGSALW